MSEIVGDPILPPDLLYLLCAELANPQSPDFSTLFECAVSSRYFATAGALSNLYKISNLSPVTGGDYEGYSFADQGLLVQKWSILWKSIILSTLDKTMYPYCRYLRVLDLRDLGFFLDHEMLRGTVSKNFFAGEMARFNMVMQTPYRTRGKMRLNIRPIMLAIGDTITKQSPILEVLTEPAMLDVFSTALLEWPSRLEKLQFLQLGTGRALADETLQELLVASCPQLHKLEIYSWPNDDRSDHCMAQFLRRLRPNSLTLFQNDSGCGIGSETCQALALHASSLITLHLAIGDSGIPDLGTLQPCTSLESLTLTDLRSPHDLKATQNDVFENMVTWLQQCTKLRDLALNDFVSAPDLLTPMLEKQDIQLHHLQINALRDNGLYVLKENQAFHQAISRQTSLVSLLLKADADGSFGDDVELLCNCLCAMKSLKRLNLTRTTEYFTDLHVSMLSEHLTNLEELRVDGYGITDASLKRLSSLPHLTSLEFGGVTTFTTNGLLDFVERLSPGNQGLALSVERAAVEGVLSVEERIQIRDAITAKVNGRFTYEPIADPDISEFEGSDSD